MNQQELAAFKPETPGELPLRWIVCVFPHAGEGTQPHARTQLAYADNDPQAVRIAAASIPVAARNAARFYEIENDASLRELELD